MTYLGNVAPLTLGIEGLTGNQNLTQIRHTQLIKATNITYESGAIQKEGGATKYNSTAISGDPIILGGWDWWPTTPLQRAIVYTNAGTLLRDTGDGTFGTTLKSSLLTTAVPVFVEGGKEAAANDRKLFVFNGNDPVQVLSGDSTTTSDLNTATDPADWGGTNQPTFGLIHEGRLWAGGNANDPHRWYYTSLTDHEDFLSGGSISIYPGEGEKLVGGISFKGRDDRALIVAFKFPSGIYIIDTSDPTIANWSVVRLSNVFGGVSVRGAIMIDDDILFIDSRGNLNLISQIGQGDLGGREISTLVADFGQFIRANYNLARLPQCRATYDAQKREAHFCLSEVGTTINNQRVILDFNRELPRFRTNDRDVAEDIWLRKNADGVPRPAIGDDAGFVWDLDQPARNKDSVGFEGRFQIPHTDFAYIDPSLAYRRKNGQFLQLILEPVDIDSTIFANIFWDGRFSETVAFESGVVGVPLGEFVLDQDRLGPLNAQTTRKRRVRGSGLRFSAEFFNSGVDQNFTISQILFYFTVGSER